MKTTTPRGFGKGLSAALVSFGLASVLGLGSVLAQATPGLQASMYSPEQSSAVRVFFDNPQRQPVRIVIYDAMHEVVYTNVLKNTEKYGGRFDLSALGDGAYTVEVANVADAHQQFSQQFTIATQVSRRVVATPVAQN